MDHLFPVVATSVYPCAELRSNTIRPKKKSQQAKGTHNRTKKTKPPSAPLCRMLRTLFSFVSFPGNLIWCKTTWPPQNTWASGLGGESHDLRYRYEFPHLAVCFRFPLSRRASTRFLFSCLFLLGISVPHRRNNQSLEKDEQLDPSMREHCGGIAL